MPLYGRRNSKPEPGAMIDWSQPLAQGLMVCLPFNEGAGSSALADQASSASWSFGGATGVPGWTATPEGYGLSFVGANEQYLVGPKLSAMPVAAWSIAWSGALATGTPNYVVLDTGGSDTNSLVDFTSGGALYVRCTNYSSYSLGYTADAAWHSYALTISGTTASLWVDGRPYSPVTVGAFATARAATIGRSAAASLWGYNGTLGHMLVWNRPLDPALAALASSANPWQLYGAPRSYFLMKPSATTTTLVRRTLSDRAGSRGAA